MVTMFAAEHVSTVNVCMLLLLEISPKHQNVKVQPLSRLQTPCWVNKCCDCLNMNSDYYL